MKLAEALMLRADMQNRIENLRGRLMSNAIVQEGEECAEDPQELLSELEDMTARLERLITDINLTNARELPGGGTLTALLARRDCAKQRLGALRDFLACASATGQRARGGEIRLRPSVPVRQLQAQVDELSAELRRLDVRIQELNWTRELIGS